MNLRPLVLQNAWLNEKKDMIDKESLKLAISGSQVILRRSLDSVKSGGQNKAAPRPLSKAVKTPAGPRPLVTQSASKQRRVGHLSIRQNSSNLSPRSGPYYPPMAAI